MGKWKLSGFHDLKNKAVVALMEKRQAMVTGGFPVPPAWFRLAPEGSKCDCCEKGVWQALKTVDKMPGLVLGEGPKLLTKMKVLEKIQKPAGLAKLYHEHCDGDKNRHEDGAL